MIFALAGNQNCGKTTLFNALTGSNQHVGSIYCVSAVDFSYIIQHIVQPGGKAQYYAKVIVLGTYIAVFLYQIALE